jgi:AbiV family abortive infection protein
MAASVNPKYLLEGAAYALEQSIALASLAQEELGRWIMLRDLRKKVLDGDHLTIEEIRTRCGDHVRKQEAGQVSIVMRADTDTVLDKVLRTQ